MGLFLPLIAIILLDTVNPMRWVFMTSFKVENQSGQDVWVTPIGTQGSAGSKARLPIYITAVPAFPSFKTSGFHLKNGQTIKIRYDWDDINFSEIEVKTNADMFYQLVIDPDPLEVRYHPPKTNHFVIPVLEMLEPINPEVLEATIKPDKGWILPSLTVGSILYVILFFRLLKEYTRLKKLQDGL